MLFEMSIDCEPQKAKKIYNYQSFWATLRAAYYQKRYSLESSTWLNKLELSNSSGRSNRESQYFASILGRAITDESERRGDETEQDRTRQNRSNSSCVRCFQRCCESQNILISIVIGIASNKNITITCTRTWYCIFEKYHHRKVGIAERIPKDCDMRRAQIINSESTTIYCPLA